MRPRPHVFRSACAVALLGFVASCVGYTLVEPKRVKINDLYSVDAQIAWSKQSQGKLIVWTVDGPRLQQLVFVNELKKGDKLFSDTAPNAGPKRKLPEFDPGMNPIEVAEFFESSLAQIGAVDMRVRNLQPARFGKLDGFGFDYTFKVKAGVDYTGFARAVVKDGRLHMIYYHGTRMHFFDKHKGDVDRLVDSIGPS